MLRRKVVAAVEGEICFMEEELGGGKVSAEIFARSNWQKNVQGCSFTHKRAQLG